MLCCPVMGSWIPGCEDRNLQNYWLKETLEQREIQVLGAQGETETSGHGLWQPVINKFPQTSLISFFVESTSLTERLLNKCSTDQLYYVQSELKVKKILARQLSVGKLVFLRACCRDWWQADTCQCLHQ